MGNISLERGCGSMSKYNYVGAEEFRPLSPWAYFGYSLLYSIPILGFIMMIINSFSSSNINKRNFTRSFWCVYIIGFIVFLSMSLGIYSLSLV